MAQFSRDVETEIIDLTDASLSNTDALDPSCLNQMVARILAADADPAEPLFGGDPPRPGDESL
ncbi:hypothetical protein [Nonomuraea harbinensis]|uniref:FXSXX-COOH protein n=1 Tax=Nonomuraea harbinensis TaxID=1286938 RepID=A0ABW1C2F3_9ACTN|nr:hypothetical protein [Nonomuraea harbinensis]